MIADNILSEGMKPSAVIVRLTKSTVSLQNWSIDDDSILGVQSQIVPDVLNFVFPKRLDKSIELI